MSAAEYIYLGHDNTIDLLLKADGSSVDLSPVTRMRLVDMAGQFDIDSQTSAAAFNWDQETTGKVVLALGDEEITAGRYSAKLIVYDPTNPDGIVWGKLVLIVE